MLRWLVSAGAILALAGCGEEQPRPNSAGNASTHTGSVTTTPTTTGSGTTPSSPPAYRLGSTVTCLKGYGLVVTAILPKDQRLRAMRDLAQKTSRQARSGRNVVALAFGRTKNDATLLIELLRVPNDPYRVERRRNVVLLYAPEAENLRGTVRACLR